VGSGRLTAWAMARPCFGRTELMLYWWLCMNLYPPANLADNIPALYSRDPDFNSWPETSYRD
jgi:hypothetical protein